MLRYLLDENVPFRFWRAIQRHNSQSEAPIDVVRVGASGPGLGSDDLDILRWIGREERILVSEDKSTLAGQLEEHLAQGHRCPGVFLVRPTAPMADVLEYLVLAVYCSDPEEWSDRITFIP